MQRKFGVFLAVVCALAILVSCAPAATPTPQVVTKVQTQVVEKVVEKLITPTPVAFDCSKYKAAYLSFGSQFPFIAIVDASMKRAAKEKGLDLLYIDNQFSPDKAVENAQTVISRGDINLVYEFNYYQQQNYVIAEMFQKANIPVIAIDIPVSGATYYGADNYFAGKIAGLGMGEWANKNWPNQVDLVLVEQQSLAGQQTLEARTLGLVAGFKESLSYLKPEQIVRFEGSAKVDEYQEAVSTLLTAHPDKHHILIGSLGDSNAVAASNAAQAAKRSSEVKVSGQGGDEVGIGALKGAETSFLGTAAYLPEHYGDDLIPLGCDLLSGKQIAAQVFIKHVFITRDNVTQYYP